MKRNQSKKMVANQRGKGIGGIVFFLILFPYCCTILFHGFSPTKKIEKVDTKYYVQVEHANSMEIEPIDDYLVQVMAGIIPSDFEIETLKAQAVVLRTNVFKQPSQMKGDKVVIDPSALNYMVLTHQEMQTKWAGDYETIYEKFVTAVSSTSSMVLAYENQKIDASFFYVSAGMTRNMNETISDNSVPYLSAVACSQDVLCTDFQKEIKLTMKDFCNKLSLEAPIESVTEIKILKRDSSNYVVSLQVGDKIFQGEDFRKKLDLNSSCFYIKGWNNTVSIQTNGVGHGIGMSQYGANQMALKNATFQEILSYFYKDTQIIKE